MGSGKLALFLFPILLSCGGQPPSSQNEQRDFVDDEDEDMIAAITSFNGGGLSGPDLTSTYHPLALAAVKKVFRDFGDLYVNETRDQSGKLAFENLEVPRPWSGYWYPFTDRSIYEGEQAPLRKYDLLLQAKGLNSEIARSELRRYEGFRPDSWEGFCDGWSLAAVSEPEPTQPLKIDGLTFSVEEQKAILTFGYLGYPSEMYGFRYLGNAYTDGGYQSLRPEAFHHLVVSGLGKDKRPLVVNDSAGIQVWNKPLYSYRWQISADPDRDNAFNVLAYALLVRERWKQTAEPTSYNDVLAPVYKYRLYVNKHEKKDGKYKVIAGEWLEESYENHPGSVKYVKPFQKMSSHNKDFLKHIEVFRTHFVRNKR